MRYPAPRKILFHLATHGPSKHRVEALRLLGLPGIPDRWPSYAKYSRESILRRLAADRRKSAKARLAVLKELLFGLTLAEQAAIEALRKERN